MDSGEAAQLITVLGEERRQPYDAPAVKRVTPKEARELLLQKADLNDPEIQLMLQCIEELQRTSALDGKH